MTTTLSDDRDRPSRDWKLPPEPAVHRAARRGDLRELERLVADGVDINERADLEFDNGPHLRGLTPLMIAARSIDGATTGTLEWLLKHDADLHATSEGGNTAAWYAAGDGGRWHFHKKAVTPDHVDRLRLLLDAGLDAQECNSIGRSLLTEAAGAGDSARLSLLLARGVEPRPKNPVNKRPDRVKALSEKLGFGERGEEREPAQRGTLDSFQLPLFCAARSGSAECVQLLLDAGADVNERDSGGQTPLMVAGSVAVVELLVRARAQLDAVDEFGNDAIQTALEGSCDSGACGVDRFDVLDALLAAGADLERVDRYGKTRLASAAFGHHDDAVGFLLARGAHALALDSEGGTHLHSICWQGEYEDPETNSACDRIIRALVDAGVDPNATNSHGSTPMHEAAGGDWGNQTAIRTLLELGADVGSIDDGGNTPLVFAAYNGEVECIRLLLAAGADPTKKNERGDDARDAAEQHLTSWKDIVAGGAEEVDTALREANEAVAKEMSELFDTSSMPDLATEDDTATRHREALDDARRAVELINSAIDKR